MSFFDSVMKSSATPQVPTATTSPKSSFFDSVINTPISAPTPKTKASTILPIKTSLTPSIKPVIATPQVSTIQKINNSPKPSSSLPKIQSIDYATNKAAYEVDKTNKINDLNAKADTVAQTMFPMLSVQDARNKIDTGNLGSVAKDYNDIKWAITVLQKEKFNQDYDYTGGKGYAEAAKQGLESAAGGIQAVLGQKNSYQITQPQSQETVAYQAENARANGLRKVGLDLTNGAANMLPSIVLGGVTGGAGLVEYAAQAGGSAYIDGLNNGMTEEQAKTYGVLDGAITAATMKLAGGFDILGGSTLSKGVSKLVTPNLEKATTDAITKNASEAVAKIATSAAGQIAVKHITNMAGQGSVMYLQNILNPVLQNIAKGDPLLKNAKLYSKEALYSAFLGALQAVGTNIVTGGIGKIATSETKSVLPNVQDNAPATDLNTLKTAIKPTVDAGNTNVPLNTQEGLKGLEDGTIKPISQVNPSADANKIVNNSDTLKSVQTDEIKKIEKLPLTRDSLREIYSNLNPKKWKIAVVKANDWISVRRNAQAASIPIKNLADVGKLLCKKLTTDEKLNFGKAVEGTYPIKTKALQDAVDTYRLMADLTHATSQSLGGVTAYNKNYYHRNWDLSDPEMAKKFETIANKGGWYKDPEKFKGVNWQSQVFKTVSEGEEAGFKLKNVGDPAQEFIDYGNSASYELKKQAIRKGISEADAGNADKTQVFNLGNGESVKVSEQAMKGLKGLSDYKPSNNILLKTYRGINKGTKQTLLGLTQFHPLNVGLLRAGATMVAEGHPILAAKGISNMFLAQLSPKFNAKLRISAANDGLYELAAKLGMPYGSSDFDAKGISNLAHGAIFGKAMPAIQDQLVRAFKTDLDAKGLSYDSPEALKLGIVGNKILGYVNTEVQNLNPQVQKGLSDIAFAPQFLRSGLELFKDAATKGGLAGSYARRSIASNIIATTLLIAGVGALVGQKSDNIIDTLLRAIVDPAIPTPVKDSNGNNIKFRTPATLTSVVCKLLGITLIRNTNGRLAVNWNVSDVPSTVADFMRSHLAILPASFLKIATNTNYAGKPMYDPNADLGTKVAQSATTLGTGLLPIGLQNLAYTDTFKNLMPKPIKQVLDAGSPSSNPISKSLLSAIGATESTDKTVGKGLSTTRYFAAVDEAKQGLNSQGTNVIANYFGSKKNPVTGVYDVLPSIWDSTAKARNILQNSTPNANGKDVLDNIITMNKTLKSEGEAVDPLWLQSRDVIVKALQYQAMDTGAEKTVWYDNNKSWYQPLSDLRNTFFGNLPAGDPNKPVEPIQYPEATPQTQKLLDQYYLLPSTTAKHTFSTLHPELKAQLDKIEAYTNAVRIAKGQEPYTAKNPTSSKSSPFGKIPTPPKFNP